MKINIIISISFFLFLVSCTENNTKSVSSSERLPISFHHYFSGELSGGIDEMVQEYNISQNAYQLNVVPIDHEAYKISIVESFKSNGPADINSYWAGARMENVIDYLEPLDDVFSEFGFEDVFDQSVLASACSYGGHYYLLPITQHYVTFFYNKSLFNQYELEEPQTWADFLIVCEVLKKNKVTPIGLGAKEKWPAQFWFDYLLLRTAGDTYRKELLSGEHNYSDKEVEKVMILWKNLIDKGFFNSNMTNVSWGSEIIEPMMAGQIGMTLMGTWLISTLDEAKYEGEYGVFSFPIIDSSKPIVALGPIDGIIIGKAALNKEGAKDALVNFASLDNQIKMAEGSGGFIPNKNASIDLYGPIQQKILLDIEKSSSWAFNYDLETKPESATLGLDFFVEFLTYPDKYEFLLAELDENIR